MGIARNIGGTLAGAVVAQAVVFTVEAIGTALYTVPADMESFDRAQVAAWMERVPVPLKIIVVIGWALAAFVGPWIALRITHWKPSGWIITAVLLAAGIANQVALPHPLWMTIAAVVLPLLGGALAQRLHHKPYPGEPLLG